ncbi:MAG TPA: mannose-1-phosphate guanylyltransferase [Membranihabitans sp.]|nr:mannose-1-phosphate guanylyltransferase [Membranihabitans sp.]
MGSNDSLKNTYFVIMAGGIGSRFWPASRKSLPKQFLDILGTGRSLIQMTYDRIRPLVPPSQILVMTHERYRDLVRDHLDELPQENVLVEPCRQNTGPCVAYVSFHLDALNPEANMVILPADHLITKEEYFRETLKHALDYVAVHPDILTLGMAPHRPDTGYGYIQLGKETGVEAIRKVESFREKPDLDKAKQYLSDGGFVWNAGIFITKVSTMQDAFEAHAPDIFNILNVRDVYGTQEEKSFILENYPMTPSISVDYAIMEKAKNVVCMVVDIGWSDIGTWKSLYELRHGEEEGIVINTKEKNWDITASDSLMIHSSGDKKIIIRGLHNMLIVDQEDILMIWPLDEEQEIKNVQARLGPGWKLE